jgi:hypothetical protein
MIVIQLLQTYASQLSLLKKILNDPDPKIMVECKKRSDWNKWKEEIETEFNSLKKKKVFIEVVPTPLITFHVGFKWVSFEREMKIMRWQDTKLG